MIRFNDAYLILEQKNDGFTFSWETFQTIIQTALQELIKRGYAGMFLVPLLFVLGACLTSYREDYPLLFLCLLLLLLFLLFSAFRIASTLKMHTNRAIWQTLYFFSSLVIGLLFGIYAASSIYLYENSWNNAVVLFVLAAIAGGSISSYCIWKKLSEYYIFCLLGTPIVVSLFFSTPETRIIGIFCLIACGYNYRQAGLWNRNFWLAHINIFRLENEIKKQKNLEKDILQERDRARQANRAKSDFLANMSHELRTPMYGILSYAEFGSYRINKVSRKKLLDYFHEITDSGNRLMTLLNDLLDLAKLEAGKMCYTMTEQDMCKSISSVVNEFQTVLEEKGLQLKINIPDAPLITVFDADRIGQVLRNLLSNSIKFSKAGKNISIKAQRKTVILDGRQQSVIMVSVSDQGIGIPAQELKTVFNMFIQSSKTTTGAGGTGLGLAICKQIVEAHNGTIKVENNPEGGALFSFTCPEQRRRGDV